MNLIRKTVKEKQATKSDDAILKILPYWPLFLILLVLSLGGALLYLQLVTPKYEAHAKILIKDEKKGSEDAQALAALDLLSPKKNSDNEIEVIQSKNLINRVVKRLSLNAQVFKMGSFKDEPAYASSPIIVQTDSAMGFKANPKIRFVLKNSEVYIDKSGYLLNFWVNTPYGVLKFIKNPRFKGPDSGTNFYFSLITVKEAVNSISSRLRVTAANKMSSIIDLSITDEVPDRAEDILNELIIAYNRSITEEKSTLAANTMTFINERLAGVENELLAIEQKQQTYRSNKGAIDVSTQGKLYLQNVSTNDQKVSEINMQLSVLNQIESYVKSKDISKGIVPSTAGISDPGLTQMVKNVYDLQLENESLKKTTGANNPIVVANNDKMERIRPQILENLDNQRQSLLASKGNLSITNGSYSSSLQSLPETERTLLDINRQQNIKSGIYTFLLQKKEETALSFVSNVAASKVVDRAESSDAPVSPKRSLVYLSSLLLAFVLGVIFIMIKESIRGKVMFQKDIEELTSLPVIGEITDDKSNNPIVIGNRKRTLIAEQFRRLRTTLSNLGSHQKRILVTSTISGEGKSFIAANLAISLAIGGKRIVLIDFDLNNPSLSAKLNVRQEVGITEYLNGKASLHEIIKPTEVDDKLFFISTGKLPENPSELMMNGVTEDLLRYLDDMFDYIIIDAAPVGPVSDAYILSKFCDATLYVVRHAFTPKIFVERIDENNKLNNLTNAAIIFNGVSKRGVGSNSYGYGYGYVYEDTKKHTKKLPAH